MVYKKSSTGKEEALEELRSRIESQHRAEKLATREEKLTPEREWMRLCFARECWRMDREGIKPTTSQNWAGVFERQWGISLHRFAEQQRRRQREKREDHNK